MGIRVNFFDLGMFDGEETIMFLQDISGFDVDYRVYGFEAYTPFYVNIIEKFKSNDRIEVYNMAISDKNGLIKLFLEKSGQGNSIFKTKNNVNPNNFIEVKSVSFVDWLWENVPDFESHINIIRFNIEGDELLLMNEIIDKGVKDCFNIYLGSHTGVDIKKVLTIKHRYNEYVEKLSKNNIKIYLYCKDLKEKNINLKEKLKNILK